MDPLADCKLQCLKLAQGDLAQAQKFYEWIYPPHPKPYVASWEGVQGAPGSIGGRQ